MGFAFRTMRPLISLKVPNYAKLFLDETHLESILNPSEPSGVLYTYSTNQWKMGIFFWTRYIEATLVGSNSSGV